MHPSTQFTLPSTSAYSAFDSSASFSGIPPRRYHNNNAAADPSLPLGSSDYQGDLAHIAAPPVYRSIDVAYRSEEPLAQPSLNPKYQKSKGLGPVPNISRDFQFNAAASLAAFNDFGRPPLPAGGYLSPNCHFFVHSPPTETYEALVAFLKQKSVDCELKPELFKLTCEAYRECARVEFVVRLYSSPDKSPAIAVEFQRRSGDGSIFCELYDEICCAFRARPYGNISARSSGRLACPPLDMPGLHSCQIAKNRVIESLVAMCKSDCVDVKVPAIMQLAEMSAHCENRPMLVEHGCVDIFLRALGCKYIDVHRCALTALANMISCGRNTKVCDIILASPYVKSLCNLTISGCPQVVRECARSVSHIAQTLKFAEPEVDNAEDAPTVDIIKLCAESLLSCSDSTARQLAVDAFQNLTPQNIM